MSGFFSTTSTSLEPNELEQLRAELTEKRELECDFASGNPTQSGFIFPPNVLGKAAGLALAQTAYLPDSQGESATRRAIADYYQRKANIALDPNQICVTASTSEAYRLLFSLLAEPGEEILAPDVSYPLFDLLAADCRLRLVHYRCIRSAGWEYEADFITRNRSTSTQAALIVSPHNPTGAILRDLNDTGGLPVLIDEVFAEFVDDTPPLLRGYHLPTPVFHLNGISKMFALPHLKLGWIVMNPAAREQFGERLAFLNDVYLSASVLVQRMAPTLFAEGESFLQAYRKQIRRQTADAARFLCSELGIDVRIPEGGTSLIIEIPGDDTELCQELLRSGVSLYPGYYFGIHNPPSVVVSCIAEPAILEKGLFQLVRCIKHRESLQQTP